MEPKYAVRCLSKFGIGLLLKDKLQHGCSPRVLGMMAERIDGCSPHLDVLFATSCHLGEKVDEVDL